MHKVCTASSLSSFSEQPRIMINFVAIEIEENVVLQYVYTRHDESEAYS